MPFDTLPGDEDLTALDGDALGDAVAEMAAHLHAGTARLLALVAEFDRRAVWATHGAMSCAHWLTWACGIDRHTAREKVRVARALESLPLLAGHLARGELSYSKVRALTRIATPDNEADLADIGLHGTANHVETYVRHHRNAVRAAETAAANERHEDRALWWTWNDDGSMVVHCRLPPEAGARVMQAIDAAVEAREAEQSPAGNDEASYPQDVPAGTPSGRPSWPARKADALEWMAERVLEGGTFPPTLATAGHEMVIHVDAAVLHDGGPGRCEVEDGPAIAAETARRIACDSALVAMRDGAGAEPLSIGRRTRAIPAAMRRALAARDRGCRFPGCHSRHRLHGHHVRHWANGGETALGNLVLLCAFHHRLVHEGGFDVERLDDGAFRFVRPDGAPVRAPTRAGETSPAELVARNRRRGLDIGARTCVARWGGEPFDVDLALWHTLGPDLGPA